MALTNIPLLVPVCCLPVSSYTQLDGENERMAACGYWPTSDGGTRSIVSIGWWTSTITDQDDVLVQIESLSSGLPNGIIAAGASGTKTVTAANDSVWLEQDLTTPYTLTSGAWLAVTLKMLSASKTHRHGIVYCFNGASNNLVWGATDIVGAATWINVGAPLDCALKTSTGEWITPYGMGALKGASLNISTVPTNPYYVGNKIQAPESVRLCGAFLPYIDIDQNIKIHLMDSSGNILTADDAATAMTITIESTYRYSTGVLLGCWVAFPKYKTLTADTAYYLMFEPNTGTNQPIPYSIFNDATIKSNTARIPTGWVVNKITSPQAWSITETATDLMAIYPVFDQIDFPAGGGAVVGPFEIEAFR